MHKIYVAVIIHILSVKWPLGTLKKAIKHQQKEADIRHRPSRILDPKSSKTSLSHMWFLARALAVWRWWFSAAIFAYLNKNESSVAFMSSYYSVIYVYKFIKLCFDIYMCICMWFIYIFSFFSHYVNFWWTEKVPF